jgi:fructokinase
MRRVIGIGETVLDIIFKGEKPLQAVPGGSAFNAIISLGRAGLPASFISETGNDRVGLWVKRFLRENGVDDKGVCVFPDSKSPISLAFLDANNDAEYIFKCSDKRPALTVSICKFTKYSSQHKRKQDFLLKNE